MLERRSSNLGAFGRTALLNHSMGDEGRIARSRDFLYCENNKVLDRDVAMGIQSHQAAQFT
jgi:hypothetical protein